MPYRAMHILVKHEESRRCSSWKDEEGHTIRSRTKEQAAEILRAYREQIVSGAKAFEDVARTESDCGSAAQGGDIGEFTEDEIQAPFFQAFVKLAPGEISDVVFTDSGAHIIKRLE
eukprot:m.154771 g.154771  ORF g.154771 m.154771 type:complete len:116 (-) comp16260_c1_seq1:126-473(-)